MSRIYLTSSDNIVKDQNNLVNITVGDTTYEHLEPRRMFPVSHPSNYITFLDEEGVEICITKSIDDLNDESKKVVLDSLADYYLVPVITKINSMDDRYNVLRWSVETDRGPRFFEIRHIFPLPDGSIRIIDPADNRFIIKGIDSLDPASRAFVIEHL